MHNLSILKAPKKKRKSKVAEYGKNHMESVKGPRHGPQYTQQNKAELGLEDNSEIR